MARGPRGGDAGPGRRLVPTGMAGGW